MTSDEHDQRQELSGIQFDQEYLGTFGTFTNDPMPPTTLEDMEATMKRMQAIDPYRGPYALKLPETLLMQEEWDRTLQDFGKPSKHEMIFPESTYPHIEIIPFSSSTSEEAWLEHQRFITRKICEVFGISPQLIGLAPTAADIQAGFWKLSEQVQRAVRRSITAEVRAAYATPKTAKRGYPNKRRFLRAEKNMIYATRGRTRQRAFARYQRYMERKAAAHA
jgi:hypothetical protein